MEIPCLRKARLGAGRGRGFGRFISLRRTQKDKGSLIALTTTGPPSCGIKLLDSAARMRDMREI